MVWMVPLLALLALGSRRRWSRGCARRGRVARSRRAPGSRSCWCCSLPGAARRGLVIARSRALRRGEARAAEPAAPWREPAGVDARRLPPGQVVLCDPATSYAIPMMTRPLRRRRCSTSTARPTIRWRSTRILDARDALDPYGRLGADARVVAAMASTVIVLNDRFSRIPPTRLLGARARVVRGRARAVRPRARARSRASTTAATSWSTGCDRAALDTLQRRRPAARPFVHAVRPGARSGRRAGWATGCPAAPVRALAPRDVAPGDTLQRHGRLAGAGAAAGRLLPGVGALRPAAAGRIPAARRGREAGAQADRARCAASATASAKTTCRSAGAYGVDLWRPDQVVRDSFDGRRCRADVAEGTYQVEVRMHRQPHYPNYRLSDYFFDDDYYSGRGRGHDRGADVRRGARPGARRAGSRRRTPTMCGINGVFHYRGGRGRSGAARAPGAGACATAAPTTAACGATGRSALGQRRLSIIDLSPGGHQPMANEDESVWVTYNGEIYNWPELRAELLAARGHRFRGNSDTEVMLHLYEEHGAGAVRRTCAACSRSPVRPRRAARLLLARDRLGIKPLYYHDDGRRIVVRLRAQGAAARSRRCRARSTTASLADYLTFQYVPGAAHASGRACASCRPAHLLVADAERRRGSSATGRCRSSADDGQPLESSTASACARCSPRRCACACMSRRAARRVPLRRHRLERRRRAHGAAR